MSTDGENAAGGSPPPSLPLAHAWATRSRLRGEANQYQQQAEAKFTEASRLEYDGLDSKTRGAKLKYQAPGGTAVARLQRARGAQLLAEGARQLALASKLRTEGDTLAAYADEARAKADIGWYEAAVNVYGKATRITWAPPMWNAPDGLCTFDNGDTYD